MKRLLCVAGALCLLTGCASAIRRDVAMPGITAGAPTFVVDETKPDDYPGYMAAEGNIYSCRYGIHHLARDEFSPSKAVIFESLLRQEVPEVEGRRVVLERFDVYHNAKMRYRAVAAPAVAGAVGGVVGAMIQHSLENPVQGFALQRAYVDGDPLNHRIPNENEVGCEDKQEGSYYASYVGGGVDVIVSWFAFRIDDKPFLFKTYYAFQPDDKARMAKALQESMRMSVVGVAQRVRPALGLAPGESTSVHVPDVPVPDASATPPAAAKGSTP